MSTPAMSSALSMSPVDRSPRGAGPQYIAGMDQASPSLQTARDRHSGQLTKGLALLLCLGLSMALLAGCGQPAADVSAPGASSPVASSSPASAPGHPPAQPGSSAAAEPASAPAPPPADAAASAAQATAAQAPPPAADAAASQAAAALPPAIVAFRKQRDACDHFRGEEPYDKQRAAFLKAQLTKACKGSDRALAALRKRFAHDPEAIAALKDYEDRIE